MHTINANVVQGRSYKNFLTLKFVIQKFFSTQVSGSTVVTCNKMHYIKYHGVHVHPYLLGQHP